VCRFRIDIGTPGWLSLLVMAFQKKALTTERKRRAVFASLVLTALLAVWNVEAQLNFLSDNRSVAASDSGQTSPEASSNYFATQLPSTPFAGFQGYAGGQVTAYNPVVNSWGGHDSAYASSHAIQNSSLTAGQLAFNSSVWTDSGSGFGNDNPVAANAEAASSFAITFNVYSSQPCEIQVAWNGFPSGYGSFTDQLELSSVNQGSIWTWNFAADPVSNQFFSDYLEPGDTYTLTGLLEASDSNPGSPPSNLSVDMSLTIVPEPSSVFLFTLASGGLAIWQLRRKMGR